MGTKSKEGCELSYLKKQMESWYGCSRGSWGKVLGDDGKEVTEGEILQSLVSIVLTLAFADVKQNHQLIWTKEELELTFLKDHLTIMLRINGKCRQKKKSGK